MCEVSSVPQISWHLHDIYRNAKSGRRLLSCRIPVVRFAYFLAVITQETKEVYRIKACSTHLNSWQKLCTVMLAQEQQNRESKSSCTLSSLIFMGLVRAISRVHSETWKLFVSAHCFKKLSSLVAKMERFQNFRTFFLDPFSAISSLNVFANLLFGTSADCRIRGRWQRIRWSATSSASEIGIWTTSWST